MPISFDGPTKRIILSSGTTSLGVRDVWSRWVDWVLTSDNSKYLPAFSQVGGNDIDTVAGTKIPVYAFLLNGWRVSPQEANHTLNVSDGVLLVDGGGDPFVNTAGSFVVRINYQQPVQAISFDSGGGGGGLTAEQIKWLKIAAAGAAGGKTSGPVPGTAGTVVVRDVDETVDLVMADVDEYGYRTDVVVSG